MKLKNFLFAAILLFLTLPSFAQQLDNLHSSDVIRSSVNGVTFRMIPVEGGTFTMGATPEQDSPHDDEKPAHEVSLSSFCIGETEVTRAAVP